MLSQGLAGSVRVSAGSAAFLRLFLPFFLLARAGNRPAHLVNRGGVALELVLQACFS